MQLGMIGLGRMGGNMVRRLLKGGHECVVYNESADAVAPLVKDKAIGTTVLPDFVKKLTKPRAIWLMVPTGAVDSVIHDLLPHLGRGDHNLSRLEMTAIQNKVAGLRRFGAASLDMAFVAAGRLDGYWERNLQPWDMAAGQIIVREAGGTVSGLEGDDDPLKSGHVLCGNEFVHAELVKILKPLGK